MKSFLNIVADDLTKKVKEEFEGQFKDVTIVFPNKRASLFFNQDLAEYTKPPLWAPRYTTISELFHSMSDLTVADPVMLIFYLYKAYIDVTGENETFDHFYSWGEVLLNDFEDIDNNLVEAEKLFINISDLESLTDFDYIDSEQEEALKRLFNGFKAENATELHKRYMKMWGAMPKIYVRFKESLKSKKLAYEGMLKREVVEQIESHSENSARAELEAFTSKNKGIAIVGFNVLNETERKLFQYLQRNTKTWFYWDFDEKYTNDNTFEAGQFITEDIKIFGNQLSGKQGIYKNLETDKSIHFIASPTDNAQCRYVGDWLRKTLKEEEPLNKSAVVLCDEHILQPVLHSIPSTYGNDKKLDLNITMGYPMQETPVASFTMALLELYFRGWRKGSKNNPEGKWRYSYAEKVLKHPYTLLLNKKGAMGIIKECTKNNRTYPSESLFKGIHFIEDIFKCPGEMQENLKHIGNILKVVAIEISKKESNLNSLYAESIYNAWTMINRFCNLMEEEGLTFDNEETLVRLIRQAISSKSVAFHGEPAIGVQIMGILETRNLDFENVILLSVNEDKLPKNPHQTSFILNFLREPNGMTTIKKQISLYAYYFYRLIQRAKNITFVYNNATDGQNKGEMSRFMLQLKYEGKGILSPNTKIEEFVIKDDGQGTKDKGDTKLSVTKNTEAISKKLNSITSLSPTALNIYLDCPLRFYLQYICGFKQEDEVTEDVEDNVFGSIFHNSMERFYQDWLGKEITKSDFSKYVTTNEEGNVYITKDGKHKITRYVDESFAKEMFHYSDEDIKANKFVLDLNGTQLLNHEVICRYVEKQIKNDYSLCPITVLHTEQQMYNDFTFTVDGIQHKISIGGIIDREDIVTLTKDTKQGTTTETVHRIVDYKTSTTEKTTTSIEDLFNRDRKKRAGYIFQAFYYCEDIMLEAKKNGKELPPLCPTLLYIKHQQKPSDSAIKIGKESIMDYQNQCHEDFNQGLKELLNEIFRIDNSFDQADNDEHCGYCPFMTVCGKKHAISSTH